jgi:hypothetical protein
MPDKTVRRMPGKKEDETCPFCKRGNLIKEDRATAFSPWTEVCRVTVPIGVCMRCGSKSFPDSAESIAEDVVHREYKSGREPRCRLALGAYFPGLAPFPTIVGEVSCARAG